MSIIHHDYYQAFNVNDYCESIMGGFNQHHGYAIGINGYCLIYIEKSRQIYDKKSDKT